MDTTSLGFQKPKEEEYYDVNIFNKNTQLTNDLIEKNSSAIGQIAEKTLQGKVYTTANLYKPADIANLKIGKVYGIIGDGTTVDGVTYHQGYGYNLMVYGHSVDLEGNVAVTQILTCTYNHQYEKRILYRNYYLSSGGWSTWRTLSSEISNPPLNINVDFKVWQRGTSFVNAVNVYTADRWKADIAVGNITVTKTSDGIKVVNNVGGYNGISQTLEADKRLIGKTVTFSCLVKSNCNIYAIFRKISAGVGTTIASSPIQSASSEYKLLTVTTKLDNLLETDNLMVKIQFAAVTGELEVKYAKLEIGEIATPLSPRPYGEEMALCQRFCVSQLLVGLPYIIDATYLWFFVPLPESLRTTPSLIAGNMGVMVNGITQTGFTFSNLQGTTNGVYLLAMKPNHGLTKDISLFSSTAIYDAEIY